MRNRDVLKFETIENNCETFEFEFLLASWTECEVLH